MNKNKCIKLMLQMLNAINICCKSKNLVRRGF